MAKMNTSHRYIYDAAPATLFRSRTAAAVTADGNSDTVQLDKVLGYWTDTNELADETLAVVINVDNIETGAEDEIYKLTLNTSDGTTTLGLGSVTVAGPGQYVILVDVPTVKLQLAGADRLTLALDVTGVAPSITYAAFMTQVKA